MPMDYLLVFLFFVLLFAFSIWRIVLAQLKRRIHTAVSAHATDDALKFCSLALRVSPRKSAILTLRSHIYVQLLQYENAMEDVNRAIERDPRNALAYLSRVRILMLTKQLDSALEDLQRAQSSDRRSKLVYLTVCSCKMTIFRQQGNLQKSLKVAERAVTRFPKHPTSYLTRAYIRSFLGDLVGAIDDYTNAIEFKPNETSSYVNRGQLYFSMGDDEKALADYSAALAIDTQYVYALVGRSSVYMRKGEVENAKQDCDSLMLNHSDNPLAHYAQARFERCNGNYADAEIYAAKALEFAPDEAIHICEMGHIKLDQGDIEGAGLLFKQANEAEPWWADAYAGLAVCSWRKQDEDQAIVYWQKAIQFDRKFTNIEWFKFAYSCSSMLVDVSRIIERFNQMNSGPDKEPV